MGKALQLCGTKLFWAERIRTFQFIMYIFEEMALKIAFHSKKKKKKDTEGATRFKRSSLEFLVNLMSPIYASFNFIKISVRMQFTEHTYTHD